MACRCSQYLCILAVGQSVPTTNVNVTLMVIARAQDRSVSTSERSLSKSSQAAPQMAAEAKW